MFLVNRDGIILSASRRNVLATYKDKDGYVRTCAAYGGKTKHIAVHRAVAEVFVDNPNPEKFKIVNHINGIRDDNRPENLEWVDAKLNRQHSDVCGNWNCTGDNHSQALLTNQQVVAICNLLNLGLRVKDIADNFNVNRHVISQIKSGRSWRSVTEGRLNNLPERAETFSKSTCEWVKEQILRGSSDSDILSIAKTLNNIKLQKIKKLIECND